MCALAACLVLLLGCHCVPRVRLYHEHGKVTGARLGAYCPLNLEVSPCVM